MAHLLRIRSESWQRSAATLRKGIRTQYVSGALGVALAAAVLVGIGRQQAGRHTSGAGPTTRLLVPTAASALLPAVTPTRATGAIRQPSAIVVYLVGSAKAGQQLQESLNQTAIAYANQWIPTASEAVVIEAAPDELSWSAASLIGWVPDMPVELVDLRSH